MKRLSISQCLLCLLLCFVACGRDPKGIIGREKMENLLYDMYRVDGTLFALHMQVGHEAACDSVYAELLRKYDVSQAQFDSSVAYYNSRASIFEKMYIRVSDRLEADLMSARQYAEWTDAHERCHLIGISLEKPQPNFSFQFPQDPHETLSQSATLLPNPYTFSYRY